MVGYGDPKSTPRTQPFNFPLEIPALQVLGALFMGNKPLVHVDHRCASPLPDRAQARGAFRERLVRIDRRRALPSSGRGKGLEALQEETNRETQHRIAFLGAS